MTTTELYGSRLVRLKSIAGIMAVFGLAFCVLGALINKGIPWSSYLFGYLFWFGVSAGSLGLLCLHHSVGGGWGYIIRRPLEAGARLIPLMIVLLIPIFLGLPHLYPWARPDVVAHDPLLMQKAHYLNTPFFIARLVVIMLAWWGLASLLIRNAAVFETRNDSRVFDRLNKLGSAGMVFFLLTMTFAVVDLVMSLEPRWFSSIIGLLWVAAQGLSTLALMLLLTARLAGETPPAQEVPTGYFRDLGNLLLAFVMLWAYMSFSQMLITYSGNTTEEVTWYVQRFHGGWEWVSRILIPFHFALPFMLLLVGSGIKRSPRRLGNVAAFILLMRLVDIYWWVAPSFSDHFGFGFADLGAPMLIGGVWLTLWAGLVAGKTVVPQHDPRVEGYWPVPEGAHHG